MFLMWTEHWTSKSTMYLPGEEYRMDKLEGALPLLAQLLLVVYKLQVGLPDVRRDNHLN